MKKGAKGFFLNVNGIAWKKEGNLALHDLSPVKRTLFGTNIILTAAIIFPFNSSVQGATFYALNWTWVEQLETLFLPFLLPLSSSFPPLLGQPSAGGSSDLRPVLPSGFL